MDIISLMISLAPNYTLRKQKLLYFTEEEVLSVINRTSTVNLIRATFCESFDMGYILDFNRLFFAIYMFMKILLPPGGLHQ